MNTLFPETLRLATILLVVVTACQGYNTGPPVADHPDICNTMLPNHGGVPQTNSPFSIEVPTEYEAGQEVMVKLKSGDAATKFKGFMLQARDKDDNIAGEFIKYPATTQVLLCNKVNNSLGHNAELPKAPVQSLDVTWKAPSSDLGKIKFYATFVQIQNTYWVKVPSSEVAFKAASVATTVKPQTGDNSTSGSPILKSSVPLFLLSASVYRLSL